MGLFIKLIVHNGDRYEILIGPDTGPATFKTNRQYSVKKMECPLGIELQLSMLKLLMMLSPPKILTN